MLKGRTLFSETLTNNIDVDDFVSIFRFVIFLFKLSDLSLETPEDSLRKRSWCNKRFKDIKRPVSLLIHGHKELQ